MWHLVFLVTGCELQWHCVTWTWFYIASTHETVKNHVVLCWHCQEEKKGEKLFILRSWRTTWIPNFQGERNATVFRLALFFFAFQRQGNTVKRQRQYCLRGWRQPVRRSNMIQVYLPSFRAGFRNEVDPTRNTSPRLSEELIVKHRKKKKKSRILTIWLSWHCVGGRRLTICVVGKPVQDLLGKMWKSRHN